MILLPLCHASLVHKKRQRHKINKALHASRGTQRSINRSENVFVAYPVRVISVAVLAPVV